MGSTSWFQLDYPRKWIALRKWPNWWICKNSHRMLGGFSTTWHLLMSFFGRRTCKSRQTRWNVYAWKSMPKSHNGLQTTSCTSMAWYSRVSVVVRFRGPLLIISRRSCFHVRQTGKAKHQMPCIFGKCPTISEKRHKPQQWLWHTVTPSCASSSRLCCLFEENAFYVITLLRHNFELFSYMVAASAYKKANARLCTKQAFWIQTSFKIRSGKRTSIRIARPLSSLLL